MNFKIFLEGKGFSKRYVYNNFLNVMIFLKWAKVEHGVQNGDWPAKPERDPEEYTDEEITTLLDEADDEERLLLSSFLCSGFRSGELANFTYADINFLMNIWRVEMKEEGVISLLISRMAVGLPSASHCRTRRLATTIFCPSFRVRMIWPSQ